jgi:hypothetical protein
VGCLSSGGQLADCCVPQGCARASGSGLLQRLRQHGRALDQARSGQQCPAGPCTGGGAAVSRAPSRCGRRRRDRPCSISLLYGALCLGGAACGQACLASAARARQHCGLTPRSRGDPTRQATLGRQPAVAGSIVGCRPRASCLAGRLSSNVRPHRNTLLCISQVGCPAGGTSIVAKADEGGKAKSRPERGSRTKGPWNREAWEPENRGTRGTRTS